MSLHDYYLREDHTEGLHEDHAQDDCRWCQKRMALIQRLDERYNTSEDPNVRWATGYNPPAPYWQLVTVCTPASWGLGVMVDREYGTTAWPNRWNLCLLLGPWSLALTREWGERR